MNTPKISCVMPTWQRANIVQNAIRSVLDQTFKDFELIIVSDGSTDGTERVVKGFEDPRIKYFNIPHSGHISRVRNYGNQQAIGELIIVQDSDDLSFPDRFEQIWRIYEVEKSDLIYHDMYVRSYDPYHNAVRREIRKIGEYNKEKLIKEQYIPGQVAYKRKTILRIPYDERVMVCDDFQMLIEFALNDCSFKYIDRALYDYNITQDSVNINGEVDGRRMSDAKVIVSILKEKYGIGAVGELKKWDLMTGNILKNEKTN